MTAALQDTFDENLIDHEFRIFGPPGTGKTTTIKRMIQASVDSGVLPRDIFVSSFTKTAAQNLVGRGLAVPDENIRTLHSAGYAALGGSAPIAEQHIKEWNAQNPTLALSSGGKDDDGEDLRGERRMGDDLFNNVQLYRARMTPQSAWPSRTRQFYQMWKDWKSEKGYVDFSDMIELPRLRNLPMASASKIGFFDEFQDFTAAETALVRHWGSYMDKIYLAGDDDQCCFRFKGADSDNFIFPAIPEDQKTFLRQSYRVPRVVQAYASKWIEKVERREVKEYHPRAVEGEIRFLSDVRKWSSGNLATWGHPEEILEDMMQYTTQRNADGTPKRVMLIASCAYMLEPMMRLLKENGMPFSNPYRPNRPEWNPLVSTSDRTSSAERLLAFLRLSQDVWGESGTHVWTPDEFKLWTEIIRATGNFKRGGKAAFDKHYQRLAELDPGQLTEPMDVLSHLMPWMDDKAMASALAQDLDWFASSLQESRVDGMRFPLEIVRKYGAKQLREDPQIILGTIHSVKGGESEAVYVVPDLSRAGYDEWTGHRTLQDSVRRLMYVAMTRASETLVFVKPTNSYSVDFPRN